MSEARIEADAQPRAQSPATRWRPYQIYILALLLLVTVCNYLDRIILGVLQEPIKRELSLSDAQLGLLSGPAFAIFYSVAGIPIARLAERINRASLLAFVVAFWSAMTAFCGLSQGYAQLLLSRVGVGMGEGGCIPISHSLLADNFSMRQRGVVMSVVSTAPSLATILAPVIGGLVAQQYGWRVAFLAVGLPGLLLAVLVWLTLKEPRTQGQAAVRTERQKGSFFSDFKWLAGNRAFVWVFVGGAFIGLAYNATTVFTVSFMIRSHGLTLAQAGGVLGLSGMVGLIGAFLGGFAADRFADDRGRSYVLVPAVGAVLTCVFYVLAFTQPNWAIGMPFLLASSVAYNLKNGPMYAAVQNIVPGTMRATGAAVFMFGATVVGAMVGPVLAGGISDMISSQRFPATLGRFAATCPGGHAAKGAAADIGAACATASAAGLQTALVTVSFGFVLAAVFLVLASRALKARSD
ncbi:MFS transporter [Caulobacter sp. Root1455]|uniref:spinster family MFS transporter n=1 Tax=Caulobacter sp. Root1455 TaxID=1736465 RepID=UPI0006F29700|nr:MFS transporter [Caulobacter sp. Root1455]KQY92283.1 MFS transporter [Caulobacter sp. Root1455]